VSPALLRHGLGETLGQVATAVHAAAGVRLHLGVGVRSWEVHDNGVRLLLEDGERIDADMAVVGVGTDPHVRWLDGSGLDHTQGIAATATCHAHRTGGTVCDSVVVAGDVARWPNLRFDTTPRRVEHWINAIEMGQAAATNLLAGPDAATPFTPVPRFWSAQHDVHIQSAGMPALADTVTVIAGSLTSRKVLTAHTTTLPDGQQRLVGLIAFDHTQALHAATRLIGEIVALPGPDQRIPA
jgi:NADPH-dependent 2,4-dienoyl-CoA reductase/sulfur reductase-like enzyme